MRASTVHPTEADIDLSGLFAPTVAVGTTWADAEPDDLRENEMACVRSASPGRRAEFASARRLARRLLATLGAPGVDLLRDTGGAPIWPAGFTGSISHACGICVAAAARLEDVLSLGVDVEPDKPIEPEIWDSVCTPWELDWIRSLAPETRGRIARAVFSAKEAVFKCQYQVERQWLEFTDVEASIDLKSGKFTANLAARKPGRPARAGRLWPLRGRVIRRGGWILSGATVDAAARPVN